MSQGKTLLALVAFLLVLVRGIELDVSNLDSIKSAASIIASNMVGYYHGNETGHVVGVLDPPYFWWEAGAMFDTLIQYWHLTGDDQYNEIVIQGLQAQKGPNNDFMPTNQSKSEGNDDQEIWALAAMTAAERQLPEPSDTTWFALASTAFNEQAARWDPSSCGGGLRWQIFPFNTGYNYKNSITNGAFFQLASRLARYTGNTTYSTWASEAFSWSISSGFVDSNWNVFDGSSTDQNCTAINKVQFSYAAGTFITGAAHMYNITSGDTQTKWKTALDGLLNQTLSTDLFFPNGVAFEVACEVRDTCSVDMYAFKGILAQWLADTIQVAPYTSSTIMQKISSSAQAAAKACTVGPSGTLCPFSWSGNGATGVNSSDVGIGEQIDALSYVQTLLVSQSEVPGTQESSTNGTGTGASSTTSGPAPSASKSSGVGARLDSSNWRTFGVLGLVTMPLLYNLYTL